MGPEPREARSVDEHSAEEAIKQLAASFADAIVARDVSAMQVLLADDFADISSGGEISSRAEFLAEYKNHAGTGVRFEAATLDPNQTTVRVHGSTAILTL